MPAMRLYPWHNIFILASLIISQFGHSIPASMLFPSTNTTICKLPLAILFGILISVQPIHAWYRKVNRTIHIIKQCWSIKTCMMITACSYTAR